MKTNLITGLKQVAANLKRERQAYGRKLATGLKRGGTIIQRESQRRAPVSTGDLKASAFTRAEGEGFGVIVSVGFTAAYALFVHEAIGMKLKGLPRHHPAKGRYWDPQGRGQAKYLENAVREKAVEVLKTVKEAVRGR